MKIIEMNYFRFAAAVAINCTERDMPDQNAAPGKVAAYIEEVLHLLFSSVGVKPKVRPIKYPKACKLPRVVELSDDDQRLFWFYPGMTTERFATELEGLLGDVLESKVPASA